MKQHNKQKHNRRALLADGLRFFTLGLFGTGAYYCITKRKELIRQGKCISDGICTGCRVFNDCGLPQALSAKQVLNKWQKKKTT